MRFSLVLAALAVAVASRAQAEVTPVEAVSGAVVGLEIAEPLTSKTSKPGDRFRLRLATPLAVNGVVFAPIGTPGEGEVIHAAKASMGGKAGELILAARFLTVDGRQIPLRATQVFRSGQNNGNAAMAVTLAASLATPPGAFIGMLVRGGETVVPEGAFATAKLAADPSPPAQAVQPDPTVTTGETP